MDSRAGLRVSPLIARSHGDSTATRGRLEFLNGPSRAACWPMNRVMSLIGSANGCKFRLADPSVSPFHCSLLRTPLGLWVVDLLGPDGVSVNDVLCATPCLPTMMCSELAGTGFEFAVGLPAESEAVGFRESRRTSVPRPEPPWRDNSRTNRPSTATSGLPASLNDNSREAKPASGTLKPLHALGQMTNIEWLSPE